MPDYREIPPDDKGYPGMTECRRDDGSTVQALGVGDAVRVMLANVLPHGGRDGVGRE